MLNDLTDRRRRIIRTDGSIELLERPLPMGELAAKINADTLDTVNLRHLGPPTIVMLVNDAGYDTAEESREMIAEDSPLGIAGVNTVIHATRARLPVNGTATALYLANCRPGTTHQIVGDVAIVPDDDFA